MYKLANGHRTPYKSLSLVQAALPHTAHHSLDTPCEIHGTRLLPLRRLARPSAWGHMNYD